jgi:hypothetical protein
MIGRAAACIVAVALLVTAVAMGARGLKVITSPNPPAANASVAPITPAASEIWVVGEPTSPSHSRCHGRPPAGRLDGARGSTVVWTSGTFADGTLIEQMS